MAVGTYVVVLGVAVAGMTGGRVPAIWAAPAAGSVLVAATVAGALADVTLPVALTTAMVLAVVTGDLQPWAAAAVVGLLPPPLGRPSPRPDHAAVGHAVRRAHAVLLAGAVATGLLLAALAPVVVSSGPWGVALQLLCCLVVALRSRRHRVGPAGPALLTGGLLALLVTAVAVWWLQPEWRPVVLATAVVGGLGALAVVARPRPPSARAGRLAEVAEALALVAVPPVLLTATGLLDVVRAMVR